jgi:hypothetical protein
VELFDYISQNINKIIIEKQKDTGATKIPPKRPKPRDRFLVMKLQNITPI